MTNSKPRQRFPDHRDDHQQLKHDESTMDHPMNPPSRPISAAKMSDHTTPTMKRKTSPDRLAGFIARALVFSLITYSLLNKAVFRLLSTAPASPKPMKCLYIVASMAEYQTGTKGTVQGEDRLAGTFVPMISHATHSLVETFPHWEIDVFLIVGYTLRPERLEYIQSHLPQGVGLQIWEDAIPLSYNNSDDSYIKPNFQSVNRQHRFVLRDKLNQYDFFIVGEDDMSISGEHVRQYLDLYGEIERMKQEALEREVRGEEVLQHDFYGELNYQQLRRMIPGFFRVEVYPNDYQVTANNTPSYPVQFTRQQQELTVDPAPCCHLPGSKDPSHPLYRLPHFPQSHQLMIWETAIDGLGVRQLPSKEWVAMLPGVTGLPNNKTAGMYWSGRSGLLGSNATRPIPHNLTLFAHQAVYMMTRDQLLDLDRNLCQGRYLPPFNSQILRNGMFYHADGKFMNSAEFWVGGLQLYTNRAKKAEDAGCNLQRVVSLNPKNFSRHLLYHVSNNKQRTVDLGRHVRAEELLRQLEFVKSQAERSVIRRASLGAAQKVRYTSLGE